MPFSISDNIFLLYFWLFFFFHIESHCVGPFFVCFKLQITCRNFFAPFATWYGAACSTTISGRNATRLVGTYIHYWCRLNRIRWKSVSFSTCSCFFFRAFHKWFSESARSGLQARNRSQRLEMSNKNYLPTKYSNSSQKLSYKSTHLPRVIEPFGQFLSTVKNGKC